MYQRWNVESGVSHCIRSGMVISQTCHTTGQAPPNMCFIFSALCIVPMNRFSVNAFMSMTKKYDSKCGFESSIFLADDLKASSANMTEGDACN